MNYIGIDIGDGESCVCILQAVSNIEPRAVSITGKKSFLSAIAYDQNGSIVIGSDAASLGAAKGFSVRFKSRFLSNSENARQDMKSFLTCLHDILENGKYLEGENKISIGCPAGWNDKTRAEYLQIIKEAGFTNARLVSESRGAFLYAKYTHSIQMDPTLIEDSALVIDIGSSTLDFAYVVDSRETGVGTFGDVYLGGGAIDEALLASAVNVSDHKKEVLSVFEEAPEWRNYCLLKARSIKEEYFTRQAKGEKNIRCRESINIMYDDLIHIEIKADDILIWREVNAPIKALNGESFYKILQKALTFAKKQTEKKPPKLVLLTGGASRMKFFENLCREQFADSQLIVCEEPELSIAKGLAYSARLDENIMAFNSEIRKYLQEDHIHNAVSTQMDGLLQSISKTMSDIGFEKAKNCYEMWQRGDYSTLNDMVDAMAGEVKTSLESDSGKQAVANEIADEMDNIGAILQPEIDNICRKYGIGESRMHLTKFSSIFTKGQTLKNVPIDMDFILNTVMIAVSAAVSILFIIIPGNQLMGVFVAILSVVAARFGFELPIGNAVKSMIIPNWVRNMITTDKVINTNFYEKIYGVFLQNLQNDTDFQKKIADSIEQGLKEYVSKLAKRTEIAILSGDDADGSK